MMTNKEIDIPDVVVKNYLSSLVGQFYKILPIKESGEASLGKYMESLQRELIGYNELIVATHGDAMLLSLLSILENLIDNDCDVSVVKTEVFKAIGICKKLQKKYFPAEGV